MEQSFSQIAGAHVEVPVSGNRKISLGPVTLEILGQLGEELAAKNLSLVPDVGIVAIKMVEVLGDKIRPAFLAEMMSEHYELKKRVGCPGFDEIIAYIQSVSGFASMVKKCIIGDYLPQDILTVFKKKNSDDQTINRWLVISGLADEPDPTASGQQS